MSDPTPTPRDFAVWDDVGGLVTVGSIVTTNGEVGVDEIPLEKRREMARDWSPEDREHFLAVPYVPHPPGRVVAITDWEGDVDDDGRSRAVYPRVGVRWAEAEEVDWHTTTVLDSTSSYDEDPPDAEVVDLIVLDTRCEGCGVSAENFGRLPVCEACRRKASCPNCGGYPAETGCYHICPNSVHYYSPEQERADEPWYGADDDRERYAATIAPEQYYDEEDR